MQVLRAVGKSGFLLHFLQAEGSLLRGNEASADQMVARNSVRVAVRTRPTPNFNDKVFSIDEEQATIDLTVPSRNDVFHFKFDRILHNAPQERIFDDCVRDIITSVLDGYNGTVMVYGQVTLPRARQAKTVPIHVYPFRRSDSIAPLPPRVLKVCSWVQSRPDNRSLHVPSLSVIARHEP